MSNILTSQDSYKFSHWKQYPEGTKYVNCYIEARKPDVKTTFFGLQAWLNNLYIPGMGQLKQQIDSITSHIGNVVNVEGFQKLQKWYQEHDGAFPIIVEAINEGAVVESGNALVQIRNTHPDFYWLPSFLETSLLRAIWYPTTVATISRMCKEVIGKYLEETGDISGLEYKLHDFGARGVSSLESANIGGAAHLINFKGTDTYSAIEWLNGNYNQKHGNSYEMYGNSIPAAEHSTVTSWKRENESQCYKNLMDLYDEKMIAIVADSYDVYNAVENIFGGTLNHKIVSGDKVIVIRPDSGDPVEVTLKIAQIIIDKFGYTLNNKGYMDFHPNVKMIQGDGVNINSITAILENFKKHGISANNIAFGMGGELLQKVNRDTFGFAMKTSAISKDGENWQEVVKDPITDSGKRSKGGVLGVRYDSIFSKYRTENMLQNGKFEKNAPFFNHLMSVYYNGKTKTITFDQVRKNARM